MRGRIALAIAVPLSLFIALVCWGFSSPIGSSPDDDFHMASVWCGLGEREGLCELGDADDERRIPAPLIEAPACFAFNPDNSADCELSPSTELVNTDRGNFSGSYPPVYYATMSLFASSNIDVSILLMRTFNALLFVGLATLLFFLLAPGRRGPLVWGTVITMVPLGMFLIPSVNPSSWAITSAVVLWVSLLAFYRETRRGPRIALAAIAVLATIMGSGARTDAAVYSGLAVVVAALLAFERTRRFWVSSILGFALIVIALFFFFTSGQSAVVDPDTAGTGGNLPALLFGNLVLLPQLWIGVFGSWGLGWLDTAMPGLVWVTTLVVFSGLLFWGLRRLNARKGIAVSLVFFALIAIPMYIFVHDRVMVGGYVQPRYILPLMILLAGVALFGFFRDDFGLTRTQLVIVGVALTIANGIAIHFNLRRYVTGIDLAGPDLDAGAEWWWSLPFGPVWIWVIGALAFAAFLTGAIVATRSIRRLEP